MPHTDFQPLPPNTEKFRTLLQDLYTGMSRRPAVHTYANDRDPEKDLSVEESPNLAGMLLTFLADLPDPMLPAFHYAELTKIASA